MINSPLQIVRNLSFGVVARGWSQVTSLVLAIVAARVLGKEGFGVYTVSTVFVVVLQSLMFGGVYDYIIKSRFKKLDRNTCFWTNFAFSGLGMLVITGLAPIISFISDSSLIFSIMVTLAPSALIASITSWQEALLLRQTRLPLYYVTCIATETAALGVALIALFCGFGVWSLVLNRYVEISAKSLVYFYHLREIPKLSYSSDVLREILKFSGDIYISNIIYQLSSRSADLLVGLLAGPAAAGSFRLSSRVVGGLSEVVLQPANTMAWVQFSEANNNTQKLKNEWRSLTMFVAITIWPLLAFVAYSAKNIIEVLVGSGWDQAAVVLVVLALDRGLSVISCLIVPLLGVCNRTSTILKLTFSSGICTLLSMLLFARYGAMGAALGQLGVSTIFYLIGFFIILNSIKMKLGEFTETFVPGGISASAVFCAVLAAGFFPGLSTSPFSQVCTNIVYATVAWLAVLMFLKRREQPVNANATFNQ